MSLHSNNSNQDTRQGYRTIRRVLQPSPLNPELYLALLICLFLAVPFSVSSEWQSIPFILWNLRKESWYSTGSLDLDWPLRCSLMGLNILPFGSALMPDHTKILFYCQSPGWCQRLRQLVIICEANNISHSGSALSQSLDKEDMKSRKKDH